MLSLVAALAAAVAVSLALPVLVLAVLGGPDPYRRTMLDNLQRGLGDVDDTAPAGRRGGLAVLARRATPAVSVRLLERLWSKAGRPPEWPLDRLLGAKLLLAAVAIGVTVLLGTARPGSGLVLLGAVVTVVAWFVPELLLYGRGQERAQTIGLQLADTLDQMTIVVEAGLGFDAAMERSARNGRGALADELQRTLQDMQLGHTRREAYEALTVRTDNADLRRFVRAVVQGDKHGISIADVLRTQSGEMRLKRRQRAEERAMQIPVKVIFPLMLCILPVLFIVLLGPVVLRVMTTF